jgi:hypothetical protein
MLCRALRLKVYSQNAYKISLLVALIATAASFGALVGRIFSDKNAKTGILTLSVSEAPSLLQAK